jgi:hypothetical protein
LASFTVSGTKAVMYDGRLLQPRTDAYSVNDTYENYLKSVDDLANNLITITESFTATSPTDTPNYLPDLGGLQFDGTCNSGMVASTTSIVIDELAGYGNDYFNNNYYMQVIKNANSVGNAPSGQIRKITDYVSASGTFTTDAFSANVEAGDNIVILHGSQIAIGENNNDNVFDSSNVVANADGSVLEREEYLQSQWGTLANTGGTATLGAIVGDVSNIDVATRLKKLNQCSSVALANTDMTGTTTRFTVAGGPVLIKHMGMLVTTALPAGANTLKFSFTPTGGVATDLCAATDTASAGLRQLFVVDGVKATALVKTTDVGIMVAANEHMPIALSTGVIQTVFSAGPPASGAATLYVEWEPLVPGATIS